MLRGWVLTDQPCNSPGCNVPLMRSPEGRNPPVQFCANCDLDPTTFKIPLSVRPSTTSSCSETSESHISRSSTPPTEISSALSSPVFAPPVETEETRRRREQSDTASAEIGKRLLKGWAMLGDECLNPRCYGVPLVRPPIVGGRKDPREECVVCGTVYVTHLDSTGRERLTPMNSNNLETAGPNVGSSSNSNQRDLGQDSQITETKAVITMPSSLQVTQGDLVDRTPLRNLGQDLEQSSQALRSTLQLLSTKLEGLSSSQTAADFVSIVAAYRNPKYEVT